MIFLFESKRYYKKPLASQSDLSYSKYNMTSESVTVQKVSGRKNFPIPIFSDFRYFIINSINSKIIKKI
jgi:hypothetical protein